MKSRDYGTVSSFNGSFAFIRPDTAERDVFAHSSELPEGAIHRGDRVSFDLQQDKFKPGKMCAQRVQFAEGDESNP